MIRVTLKLPLRIRSDLARVKTLHLTLTFTATGAGGKTLMSEPLTLRR
jgi:hypothetical protein